jgi:mannitol/fructose-specific phosphotransferase system IIA component (Ntr-type)
VAARGPVLLTDFLTPDRVVVPLAARDKRGVLAELTRVLVARTGGAYDEVLGAVQERESVLSTGIGDGVAIPHARSVTVPAFGVVAGVSPTPIPFDAIDGQPVQLFFLIVGPEAAASPHVKALSRIARLVRHVEVRRELIGADSPEAFCRTLVEVEAR